MGPKAAIVTAGDVRLLPSETMLVHVFMRGVPAQIRPVNQAVMYLGPTGTLVCLGMPGGGPIINVPLGLLIAKVSSLFLSRRIY